MRYTLALAGLAALATAAPMKKDMGSELQALVTELKMTLENAQAKLAHANTKRMMAETAHENAEVEMNNADLNDVMQDAAQEQDAHKSTTKFYDAYSAYGTYGPYGIYNRAVEEAALKAQEHANMKDVHTMGRAEMMHADRFQGPVVKKSEMEIDAAMGHSQEMEEVKEMKATEQLPYNWYGKYDPYGAYPREVEEAEMGTAKKEGAEIGKAEGAEMAQTEAMHMMHE